MPPWRSQVRTSRLDEQKRFEHTSRTKAKGDKGSSDNRKNHREKGYRHYPDRRSLESVSKEVYDKKAASGRSSHEPICDKRAASGKSSKEQVYDKKAAHPKSSHEPICDKKAAPGKSSKAQVYDKKVILGKGSKEQNGKDNVKHGIQQAVNRVNTDDHHQAASTKEGTSKDKAHRGGQQADKSSTSMKKDSTKGALKGLHDQTQAGQSTKKGKVEAPVKLRVKEEPQSEDDEEDSESEVAQDSAAACTSFGNMVQTVLSQASSSNSFVLIVPVMSAGSTGPMPQKLPQPKGHTSQG